MYKSITDSIYYAFLFSMLLPFLSGLGFFLVLATNHLSDTSLLFGSSSIDDLDLLKPGYVLTQNDVESFVELDVGLKHFAELMLSAVVLFFSAVFLSCLLYRSSFFDSYFSPLIQKFIPGFGVTLIPDSSFSDAEKAYASAGEVYDRAEFELDVQRRIDSGELSEGFHRHGPVFLYVIRKPWMDKTSHDSRGYLMVGRLPSISRDHLSGVEEH